MGRRRAVKNGAGWVIPGLVLLLLPKCPLCLAAVFSLLFGIGLSADATRVVHGSIIVLCAMFILIFAARQFRAVIRGRFVKLKDALAKRNPVAF
jgi:hypothetical protein